MLLFPLQTILSVSILLETGAGRNRQGGLFEASNGGGCVGLAHPVKKKKKVSFVGLERSLEIRYFKNEVQVY